MRRRWWGIIFVFMFSLMMGSASLASAQQENVLQIAVESAFVRALPDEDSTPMASVFANESLIAIGRNMDGTWLQVQRPFNQTILGWLDRRLATFTFEIAGLPLTDFTTGVSGADPVVDTGFALLTISNETPLRAAPDRDAETLALLPYSLTLPIVERTPNLQWIRVNYRGTLGWLPVFLISTTAVIGDVPISPEYSDDASFEAFTVVTLEQQIAQADRLIAFIAPLNATAAELAVYWEAMLNGDTLECLPRDAGIADFVATPEDIQQLPEMRGQLRLLRQAVADLNAALETTQTCGLLPISTVNEANANTLNALTIFRIVLNRITAVRDELVG
jgi:hypothetical protein